MAQKFSEEEKRYYPYVLPEGALLYSDDMLEQTACAQCAEKHAYGFMFTSRQIHTQKGMGYAVCAECYLQEMLEYENAND